MKMKHVGLANNSIDLPGDLLLVTTVEGINPLGVLMSCALSGYPAVLMRDGIVINWSAAYTSVIRCRLCEDERDGPYASYRPPVD